MEGSTGREMDELDEAIEDDSALAYFWDRAKRARVAGLPLNGCGSVDSPLGGQAEVREVA